MKSQLGKDKVMDLLKSLIDTGEDGKEAASTSSKKARAPLPALRALIRILSLI